MTETPFTILLVATLVALLLAGRGGRWGWALLACIALGAAALTRPVAQVLVLLVPLAFLVDRGGWRSARNGSGRARLRLSWCRGCSAIWPSTAA